MSFGASTLASVRGAVQQSDRPNPCNDKSVHSDRSHFPLQLDLIGFAISLILQVEKVVHFERPTARVCLHERLVSFFGFGDDRLDLFPAPQSCFYLALEAVELFEG